MPEAKTAHRRFSVYLHRTGKEGVIVEADMFVVDRELLYFYNLPIDIETKPIAVFKTWDRVVDYETTEVYHG